MNTRILLRLSGLAALAGGVLRMASTAPLPLGPLQQEALWDLIDVLLTLGLVGIYLVRAGKLGVLGLAGFVLAMASLSFIGGPDADVFGFSTYQQGAAALAISLVGLSLAWLRAGERPWGPPLCWFGTVIASGALGMLPSPLPDYGFMAAGILFGAGFVIAGWDLLRRSV
jgi:hypothetical protein